VSAHDAPDSDGFARRGDALFVENLRRLAAGEQPLHLADPATVKQSAPGRDA
jgi:hypothetical protein